MGLLLDERAVQSPAPNGPAKPSRPRWLVVLAAGLALMLGVLAAWTGTRLAPDPEPAAADGGDDLLDELAPMPLTFVENRGQRGEPVRFHAQGSRYAFSLAPAEILLSFLDPSAGAAGGEAAGGVTLALRFPGGDPDVVIEGVDPTGGQVNYLRGDDPDGWHTDLAGYGGVVYRELWPGIDMVLRGDGGQLKYEFHVRPGADPEAIALAYAGADGLRLDTDGALLVGTPIGELRDSAPVAWQHVGGERVPVASRYAVTGGTTEYGFALGAYDPQHALVIDPALDYSTFIGGSQGDSFGDMAVDSQGNVYVAGWTTSTDFPTTPGAFDTSHNGGVMDVLVTKLSPDGTSLVYSTYLGGTTCAGENPFEFGHGIAVDGDGHAYVTGATTSTNFPTTAGAFQTQMPVHQPSSTCQAAFVTKLTPAGSGLVYSTFLGGTSQDSGRDIAIDATGNAYITGDTCSQNFPTTSGAFQTSRGAGCAAFLAKLNAAGSGLAYSTYLGAGTEGSDTTIGDRVAVDGAGNAYVAGATRAQDFPSTPDAFQPSHPGGDFIDLFTTYVVKVNPQGSDLVYGTFLGGTKREVTSDLVIDGAGHAYVSGATQSPEFPVTPGAYDTEFTGSSEGFLTKLTPDGSDLVFSTFRGGAPGASLALDADDNIWLAGGTSATNAFTTEDAFSQQNSGMSDAWFGLLDATGSQLLFGSYFGGSNSEGARSIAVDAAGVVFIGGTTRSFDLPTTQGAFQTTLASGDPTTYSDLFVARFGDGGGVLNPEPPPPTRTDSWSGEIDREQTIRHFANVHERGTIEIDLDWDRDRADLKLRAIHSATGTVVFEDFSSDKPKQVSFHNDLTGLFAYDVINDSRRKTDYTLSVTSPLSQTTEPPALTSVSVDPATVTGGESSTGTVRLSVPARAGGEEIDVLSSDPAVAAVPVSVTVPQGAMSATFPVTTSEVSANTSVTITASYIESTRTATLDVNADGGPEMSQLALDPTVVQGGDSATGTATLTGPAPPGGALVTLGSSNTAVATVPPSVTVPEGETGVEFTISTSPQDFNQSSAISASHGGVTRSAILSVTAGPAPALSSLSVDPSTVVGGEPSTGTVTLTAPAPFGGLAVALSSSDTDVATVPSSVTVGSGSTSATFTVSTSEVSSSTSVEVTAEQGGVTRTAVLSVEDASGSPPDPELSTLSLSPTSVEGGGSSTGTVTLSAAAPSGGASVALSSSNTSAATVPSSVTVPAGSTSASFTVSTSSVSSDTSATISASYGGATRTASLSVTAPPPSTDTVTVERARYRADKQELEVRASSSGSGATLTVYVTATDQFIGTLGSDGRGKFDWPTNPENITVRSSLGGSATRSVELT